MQTNQNFLIPALIIILGLAVGYFYYSSIAVPAQIPIPTPPVSSSDDLKAFEALQIDYSILSNKKFPSLQIFGESPVNPGATGKQDLFSPI